MSSSGSNVPLNTQHHTRAQEGLALVWSPVPGAIRYGFVVGFADMPVPPIEAIMRGAAPGFTVLGIPPRFSGAVDLGSPVGEERQYALIAYRGDGAMAPVAGVQFLPARSAPRDREYHPLIPPALTRPPGWTPPIPTPEATTTAPTDAVPARREPPADPWAALESASGAPASSPATPVSPSPSAGTAPAQPADPWAALDAAAREQQPSPAERPTPSVSFAAPQAAAQPPVAPPDTPAGRPIERAPEQQPEPRRERQAEPARQDVTPTPAERPAASLREQAPAASQAEAPAASEQQGERKAGRWGVFQALRQKIVTPIIPPPAREDQPQAPDSPPAHSQAEARTPEEAPPAVAPAASISPAVPSSTTPSTPPASEPVEAVTERQREQTETIREVQARTDVAPPVERVAPPEVVEERPAREEREEAAPEQAMRQEQEAEAFTPEEERPDEQIILPEPVAFVEQPPTVAEESSDDWIAQAEAELAAQWAARNGQEEERPDISAEAAPDVEAASDVQEGVTPNVAAEVAPNVSAEAAPNVSEGAAPGVTEGAALAASIGATPDAMGGEEQAAIVVPGELEQAAVSSSPSATGPAQAPLPEVQIAEPEVQTAEPEVRTNGPDVPSVPAAVADEGIASTAGENIVPAADESITLAGEASAPITPEPAPVQARSVETLAAETGAPVISETIDTGDIAEMPTAIDVPSEEEESAPAAVHWAPGLAVENLSDAEVTAGAAATIDAEMPQPAEEAATLGDEHEDVEPPYVAPVEAQAAVTPTGSEASTAPTGIEAPTASEDVEAIGVPIGAEAPATPVNAEALVAPEAESLAEEAELATAETPGDVPADPALAATTTAEAAIEYGHGESGAGSGDDEGAQFAPPVAAESEFAAGSSALDEADEAVAPSGHETPIVADANRIPVAAGVDETTLNATPANEVAAAGAMEGAPTTAYSEPAGAVEPSVSEVRVEQPERHEEVGNAPESEQAAVIAETTPADALAGQAEPPIDAPRMGQAEQETPLSASALPEELPVEPVGDPREEHPDGAVTPVLEEPVAVDAAAESTAMAMSEASGMPEAMAAPEAESASGIAADEETAPALETTPPPVLDVKPSHTDEEPDHEAVAAEAPLQASTMEGDQAEQIAVVESADTMPAPEPIPVASVEPTPPASLAESAAKPSIQAEETAGEQAKEMAAAVAPAESDALPEMAESIGPAEPAEAVTPAAPSWEDAAPEVAPRESKPVEAEPPATETVPAEPEPPIVPVEAEPSAAAAANAEESPPALDAEPAPPAVAAEFVPTLSAASAASIEPEPVAEPEVVPETTVTPEPVPEPEVARQLAPEPEVMPEPVAEPMVDLSPASVPEVAAEVEPEPDPALAGPPPSPSEAVAMLDEAELYLLPTWLDLAAAARLLAQAARAIPGDPRLLDLQRQLHDAQAADDGEDVEDLLREARAALERRDYWGAVDSYEQALTQQEDNAEARQGLERARVLARWSAQMSGAGSDAGRLQHIGDDFMEAAPDLAAQSYAAAFAAHPTIVILRGLLLSQAHGEQWDGLAESAAHGVETLRQSGRIAADPAQDAAVALLRQQMQASTALGGVQGAIENLIQTLVASAQQGRH